MNNIIDYVLTCQFGSHREWSWPIQVRVEKDYKVISPRSQMALKGLWSKENSWVDLCESIPDQDKQGWV